LLIASSGQKIGVVPTEKALYIAKARGLDLVEVAPNANPPVCKLMDFGRFIYAESKKIKQSKKKQQHGIKSIKIKPKIDTHDYEIKLKKIREFIEEHRYKVKVFITMRGRELSKPEMAQRIIDEIIEDTKSFARMEEQPQWQGRMVHLILSPKRGG
jgi:translation initiation factor IF-3